MWKEAALACVRTEENTKNVEHVSRYLDGDSNRASA